MDDAYDYPQSRDELMRAVADVDILLGDVRDLCVLPKDRDRAEVERELIEMMEWLLRRLAAEDA